MGLLAFKKLSFYTIIGEIPFKILTNIYELTTCYKQNFEF